MGANMRRAREYSDWMEVCDLDKRELTKLAALFDQARNEALEDAVDAVYDIPLMSKTSRKDIADRIRALKVKP